MSLQGSPRLELDLPRRRWERRVAWFALTLAPVPPLLILPPSAAAAVIVLMLVVMGAGLLRAGWIGGRHRLERIVWSSDDRWLLTDARGQVFEGTLRADSRVGGRFVWLRWNAIRTRSMLLVSGDTAEAELRRLIVRLRLEGQTTSGAPGAKTQLS